MGVYQRGQAINIVQTFWLIDPITRVSTPANPTTVVFEVLAPDNVETTYTWHTDTNVTNPSTGTFLLALSPPLPPGTYRYRCTGTGAVEAASEDMFDVLESGVLSPVDSGVATPGPCASWINGDDVAYAGPPLDGIGSDTWLLDDVAYDASYVLYELSGRQFPGVCTRTVRPNSDKCSCWAFSPSLGMGPWAWAWTAGGSWGGWGWRNECGDLGGCNPLQIVRLAGYPVREILSVKIDGTVLPLLDDNSNPNYRLDGRRNLVRMANPVPTFSQRFWPGCQQLDLDDTQSGTFSVTYTWGADVPHLGRVAASILARELWNLSNGGACALPSRVTEIVRQGITMKRTEAFADMFRLGATGIQEVDLFISMVNPIKMKRRPAVFSPDLQRFARRVGQ